MARGFAYTLTLADRFSQTFDKWNRGIQGAARQADQSASVIQRSMGRMMAGVGAAIAGTVPIMAASFIPLENKLAELETVSMRASTNIRADMDASLQKAREWSSKHVQSTTEVIEAQFQLATAGLNAQEAMAGVAQAAVLATATGERLSASAMLLASLFNTFGQTADLALLPLKDRMESISDSLAMTIQRFQVTINPLRQGLAFVTGQAVQLGLSLNEVNVALGIMNTAGIRASNAGTGLQNVFIRMDEAIREMDMNVQKFTNDMGEFTGIADFIDEVATSLGKMSKFERVLQVQRTFGQRAARTVLVLMQQRDQLRQVTAEMNRQSGAAKAMQEVIERTTGSRMKIAMNNVKNFSQAVGEGLAGALKSAADSFAGLFKWLLEWAQKTPVGVALTITFTGVIMALTGAVIAYKAVVAMATGATIAWGAALMTVVTAFLAMTVIGGIVLLLGYLISNALSTKDVMARLADTTDTFYQSATKSFGLIANAARLASTELEGMKKSVGGFDARRLEKLGFSGEEIQSLAESFDEEGFGIGKAFADRVGKGIRENLKRFGFEGSLGGLGESLAVEMEGIIGELGALEGAQYDLAISAMGSALDAVAESMFQGSDAGRQLLDVLGSVTKAEQDLVAAAQGTKLPLLSGEIDLTGAESALEITKALFKSYVDLNRTSPTAEQLTEFADEIEDKFGEANRVLAESVKAFSMLIRSPETMAELRKVAPEIAEAMGGSLGTSFRAIFDREGSKIQQTQKTWLAKTFSFDSPEDNLTAIEAMLERITAVKQIIARSIAEGFDTGYGKASAFMKYGIAAAQRYGDAFTAAALNVQKSGDAMEKAFTGQQVSKHINNISKSLEALENEAYNVEFAMENAQKIVNMWGTEGGPSYDQYMQAVDALRVLRDSLSSNLKAQGELKDQAEEWRRVLSDIGIEGHATEQMLKGAASALSEAFGAGIDLGDFGKFRESLYDSVYDGIKSGIIEGAAEALRVTTQMFTAFDPKALGEKYRQAIESAKIEGGGFDIEKLKAAMAEMNSLVAGQFTKTIEQIRPVFDVIATSTNDLQEQMAAALGTTDLWSEKMRKMAEDAIPGLDQLAQSVARIRSAMVGADLITRQYLQAAEAFRTGAGNAFGVDVGSLSLSDRLRELETLIENARRQAPQSVSFLQDNYQRLLEDQVRSEAVSGRFGENMVKAADAAKNVATELDKPLKMTSEIDAIADNLERGQAAATAIRDALSAIAAGKAIPEVITIRTTGGGGGTGGTASVTYNGGAVQVNIDGNAAVTQQDLNTIAQALRDEYEKRVQEVIGQIEASTAGR